MRQSVLSQLFRYWLLHTAIIYFIPGLKLNCKNILVLFDYLPDENHATIAHNALFNALKLLYPATDIK